MTENRASSGVRNLRAMFENPSATSSPEPRGRSPASRIDTDSNSRPTSKIRASFVPVEGTPRVAPDLGATKGTPSGVNDPHARRRGSFSVSEDLGDNTATELKRVVSEEKEARKKSNAIPEAVPEEAVASRPSSRPAPPIRQTSSNMPNLGSIMKGSDFPEPEPEPGTQEKSGVQSSPLDSVKPGGPGKAASPSPADAPGGNPDKTVSGTQDEVSLKPGDTKDRVAVSGGHALPPPTEPVPSSISSTGSSKAATGAPANGKANGAASPTTTNGKTPIKKPAAIVTGKTPAAKASAAKSPLPKSPGIARLPKTPVTPKAASSSATTKVSQPPKETKVAAPSAQTKAPAPKASRASLRPSTVGTTTSAAAKAKVPAQETKKPVTKPATSAPKESTTTSPGGFKKPKPRSPTRPVRLPSHLTAPTASSAAKYEEDNQKLARKPSVVSRPGAPKTAPTARKQPSRASLAPSTASTTKRPESRTSTKGASDEGFLARMMRPTTASASKTHDKVTSPPRRGASVKAPAGGVVAKGKKKVAEVAFKAKEAVTTNGHSHEESHTDLAPSESPLPSVTSDVVAEKEAPPQSAREVTPVEQMESSAVELQTPDFETQAIR